MTAVREQSPATTPGAMQETKRRELINGSEIVFESAPYGWLTKKGEPRLEDYRAYYFIAQPDCLDCEGSGRRPSDKRPGGTVKCSSCKGSGECKRERMTSVTTLLDSICPKGGLPRWAEARGIEGALAAMKLDEVHKDTDPEDAIKLVRHLKLGADRARDVAANRGLNVHALNEDYMLTGTLPHRMDHPVEHHGYIEAWHAWLKKTKPDPIQVEELVCDPSAGYAGRRDLVARAGGLQVGYDFKTQENGCIFSSAHVQLRLYERGSIACGDDPCDELRIVVFAANGEYREMPCEVTQGAADAALAYYEAIRPVDSTCESWNRSERRSRATT